MKFRVTMKDPDALEDAILDAVDLEFDGQDPDTTIEQRYSLEQKVKGIAARFFRDEEYLVVEIDTEADTCVVLPVGN